MVDVERLLSANDNILSIGGPVSRDELICIIIDLLANTVGTERTL